MLWVLLIDGEGNGRRRVVPSLEATCFWGRSIRCRRAPLRVADCDRCSMRLCRRSPIHSQLEQVIRNVQCLTTGQRLPPIFSDIWHCLIVGQVNQNAEGCKLTVQGMLPATLKRERCVDARKGWFMCGFEVLADTIGTTMRSRFISLRALFWVV